MTERTDRALAMNRAGPWRWVGATVFALLLIFAAIWVVLYITKGRFLRPVFERAASAQLHRQVKVAGEFNFYFDPIEIAFRADGLTIANAPWAPPANFLDARNFALRLHTLPLLWGEHRIAVANVTGAHIALQWDAQHLHNNWTFDSDAHANPLVMPDIERGTITDTHVDYADPRSKITLSIDLQPIAAVHSQIAAGLGFAGTGTFRARPVRFTGSIAQPDQTLHSDSSAVVLHAQAADTVMDISGRMPGLGNIGGGQYHLAARGANMADLFSFIGVVVVPTRHYHVESDFDRERDEWVFSRITGQFGDSDLAGRIVLSMHDDRLHLDADLHTASLDLIDAAPVLGFDPKRLDQMGTKGLIIREGGHPRILPDTPMPSDQLRHFDADARYRIGEISAKGFPVGQIDLTLRLDHGLMTIKPMTAVVAGGKLDLAFTVDARHEPVKADYMLHLHQTPMGQLLARFGVKRSGTSGTMMARLALHGVGNSLRENLSHASGRMAATIPSGTMSARDIQLSELDIGTFVQRMFQNKLNDPVEINCGLVAFTVNSGVAAADPILIDTKKNIITGTGQFSFRDESVDLKVRAKGKKFSLFSLQSPVGVDGYLAQPRVKVVSPQLLTRAGAGGALALAAGPLAALIAFVDPGNGKAAACGPVLAGASAAAQHTNSGKPVSGLERAKP